MRICVYAPWKVALNSNYCRILQNAGYDVVLFRSDTHFDADYYVFEPNVLLDRRQGKVKKIIEAINRFKQIRAQKPDVVFMDVPQRLPVLVMAICVAVRFPVVAMMHNAEPHDKADRLSQVTRVLTRIFIRKSRVVLGYSHFSAQQIQKRFPSAKVCSVPLVPSLPPFGRLPFSNDRKNFAIVGRWSYYKGFDVGFDIWSQYTSRYKTDSVLDVWCSGLDAPTETPLNIHWRAHKKYAWDEFEEALRHYKAVLMPYRTATQSGVQVLAWDFGVATLISNLPGLVELQPQCLPALDLEDVEGWVQAIHRLDSLSEAIAIGQTGLQESRELCGEEKVLQDLRICLDALELH